MRLVQLCCRRYQPRGVSRALPWRVAQRRLGSLMVVRWGDGVLWVGQGLAEWAVEVQHVQVDVCVVYDWSSDCHWYSMDSTLLQVYGLTQKSMLKSRIQSQRR